MHLSLKVIVHLFTVILFGLMAQNAACQYNDNPLKDKRWATVSIGANTADNLSWMALGTYSTRGDFFLSQLRVAYSQELVEATDDPFTFRKNRMAEVCYLLGDGWGGKKWYATGAIGFGLNVRMYADSGDYQMRYVTAVSPGIPIQIELGALFSKSWGMNLVGTSNFNLRQTYHGVLIGVTYRLK